MDTTTLYPVLRRIYAAFNRNAPYQASEQFLSILERVNRENITEAALEDIANAISDYETAPQNMGRAIIKEFREWLSTHPTFRDEYQQGCEECRAGGLPGFIFAYQKNGKRVLFKCKCNTSEAFSRYLYIPKNEIVARGWILRKTDEKWRADNIPSREEREAFLENFIASIPDIPKKTDEKWGEAPRQALCQQLRSNMICRHQPTGGSEHE